MRLRLGGDVGGPGGLAGRVFRTLFFGVFLGLGLWFAWLVAAGFIGSLRTYSWPPTRCVIEASGVEEHPGAAEANEAYLFRVRYHYEVAGRPYVGVRFRPGYTGSSDVGAAQRLAERYAAGSEAVCYADPERPESAMLQRPSLWTGLLIFFPLIFVAAGAGGIAFVWRPRRGRRDGAEPRREPISGRVAKDRLGGGCLVGFFAIFLLAGLGFFIPFFGLPAWRTVAARTWVATPCTILHSEVRAHPGDESTTYSVDVLFAYRVGGREYKSSRYDFSIGSSSGIEAKREAVANHPPGSSAICYVDPEDPTRAVLDRGLSRELWFGLLPLVFVAVGAGGMAFAIASLRKKAVARAARGPSADWLPAAAVQERAAVAAGGGAAADAAATLEPATGPVGKFVGLTLVALFWNGIVGVFLWQLIQGYRQGQPDGCLTLFLVPFVLVGLLLLVGVPYQLLALFNPRPVLSLSVAAPRLGEAASLEWRFRGFAGRIRRLRITLEGREEATYTRGTTTSTDKETFATVTLVDADDTHRIAAGSATLEAAADTMHSFNAPHNKIVWTLKVAGEIRRWPDLDQTFPLVLRPRRMDGGEVAR